MAHIGRWRKMKYGTGERNIERNLAVLLLLVCTSMGTQEM